MTPPCGARRPSRPPDPPVTNHPLTGETRPADGNPAGTVPAGSPTGRALPAIPLIEGDDNLERILSLMDAAGENHLPVVDNARDLAVIGILHHNRVLREYNKALLSAHAEEHDER